MSSGISSIFQLGMNKCGYVYMKAVFCWLFGKKKLPMTTISMVMFRENY